MSNEINRIKWKCRRGMREIDLLLREFSRNSFKKLSSEDLLTFDEVSVDLNIEFIISFGCLSLLLFVKYLE